MLESGVLTELISRTVADGRPAGLAEEMLQTRLQRKDGPKKRHGVNTLTPSGRTNPLEEQHHDG